MAKHSVHYINALKKEKERLIKRRLPLAKKIGEAEAELDNINSQINGIDAQLGEVQPEPDNQKSEDQQAEAA